MSGPAGALPRLALLPGHDGRLAAGHPWAYSNEIRIDDAARAVPPGGLVRLVRPDGEVLGIAGFNRHALIAARVLSRDGAAPIDATFFAARFKAAETLRNRLFGRPFYRLAHAEADGLPGLIADRYGEVVVVQANTALMDRLEAPLLEGLRQALAPGAILLRNDSAARALEGLATEVRPATGTLAGPVELEENGARYLADLAGGQKTGWFYDQRENRTFAARLAPGLTVLDAYAHTGGFGILAALAGARQVVLLDRSQPALDLAGAAARLNGLADRIELRRSEAFEELQRIAGSAERYGLVIVDPPAFVKARKDLAAGLKGYRKLARLAARCVAPGGFLLACSCSQPVEPATFAAEIARGLVEAGRTGRILRSAGAGPDHPLHPLLPESAYLKCLALQLD